MSIVKVAEKFNKKIGHAVFRSLREKGGFGSIRFFVSGAAALPPEVAQGFERLGMVILQGYGLTEASPVVSVNRFGSPKHDSVGPVISGVEVKVLNPDETGVGELMFRGDNVMLGYYNNTEATEEVLKDGWLYTGDSGWVDEDGHIHIAGRLKNVIVTKAGKNIYPEEIEGELSLSPYIAEVLVFGAVKASSGEEYVKAIVVPDYEYLEQENMDTDEAFLTTLLDQEIRERCANLADYKRVKEFELRKEEFPKTSTRKIKRFLLQQQTQ
jgi:long-chain acyl-CoA synthetase